MEGEQLWRALAPQVLGALVRRYGDFDRAEDAVQEALLAASRQWPRDGMPHDPRAWLVRVASRRLIDHWRSDDARARRERAEADALPTDALVEAPADAWVEGSDGAAVDAHGDDTLTLLLLCCHPALTPPSQVALTLRAVGGLTTAEIASAFLVPESTMAQRISRAKQRIREAGAQFRMPEGEELRQRMAAVLHALYLVFNEGYTTSHGAELQRVDLTQEAIRLTRAARELLPEDGEVAGLLALMLLTEARRPARTAADGSLVPLAEQDRSLWLRPDRGGRRARHLEPGIDAGRPLPASGRDRGGARRGTNRRGHRLGAGAHALRDARAHGAGADGDARSRRRPRHGARAGGRGWPSSTSSSGQGRWAAPPAALRARAPARAAR